MEVLGIDIGGTGIKGAIVNVLTGELVTERIKFATPPGAHRQDVYEVVNKLIKEISWDNSKPIGFGFPSVIKDGVCKTATNISKSWIGEDIHASFRKATNNNQIFCLNDADAAGLAEISYNPESVIPGTAIFLTIGTGIGSAIFKNGRLLRNTELGSLEYKGDLLEKYASNKTRKQLELDYTTWAKRLDAVLSHIEKILHPDLFILGGGVSKRFHLFEDQLNTGCTIRKSKFENAAGCIGAAYAAYKTFT